MSKKITCTRCLGKGYVDKKDIKRLSRGLNRVSEWDENSDCRFCGGKGKISEKFASKHNPDSEKFPNIVDYSGFIDFLNLSEEEKNDRFNEAWERVNGSEINFDEEDDNEETDINFDEENNIELENNSQSKTIFWTAFVSVILTLGTVLYFSGELNNESESDISIFFKSLVAAIIFLGVPATIIYRTIFGRIKRDIGFLLFFAGYSFINILYFFKLFEELDFFSDMSPFEYRTVNFMLSSLIVYNLQNWVFISKSNQDN